MQTTDRHGERDRFPLVFLAAGAVVAGLTGSLGCVFVGAVGVLGMLGAFSLVAAPLAVLQPVRSSP